MFFLSAADGSLEFWICAVLSLNVSMTVGVFGSDGHSTLDTCIV